MMFQKLKMRSKAKAPFFPRYGMRGPSASLGHTSAACEGSPRRCEGVKRREDGMSCGRPLVLGVDQPPLAVPLVKGWNGEHDSDRLSKKKILSRIFTPFAVRGFVGATDCRFHGKRKCRCRTLGLTFLRTP